MLSTYEILELAREMICIELSYSEQNVVLSNA
jgi:hypothetical protein